MKLTKFCIAIFIIIYDPEIDLQIDKILPPESKTTSVKMADFTFFFFLLCPGSVISGLLNEFQGVNL